MFVTITATSLRVTARRRLLRELKMTSSIPISNSASFCCVKLATVMPTLICARFSEGTWPGTGVEYAYGRVDCGTTNVVVGSVVADAVVWLACLLVEAVGVVVVEAAAGVGVVVQPDDVDTVSAVESTVEVGAETCVVENGVVKRG